MIERIAPVLNAAAVSKLPDGIHVYRNDRVPREQTNGITPYAVDLDLPVTVGATLAHGAWLNPAIAAYPGVVPGWAIAAGIGATVGVGAVAGLYPAIRAARLSPTEALVAI